MTVFKWRQHLQRLSVIGLLLLSSTQSVYAETDRDEVARVLSYGLRAIHSRTLSEIPLSSTTVEGLRGLATVDASLSVTFKNKTLTVYMSDDTVGTWPAPTKDNADNWSDIAIDVINRLGHRSHSIRDMDSEELYQAFFDSALSPLDPFSRYAGRQEAEQHQERRNGFGGVGIRYRMYRHYLEITRVLNETPAKAANIQPGDHIIRINDTEINSISRKAVHDLLRGPVGSSLVITIQKRNTEQRTVTLERSLVSTPTAFIDTVGDIPRLRITRFSQQTASLSRDLLSKIFSDHSDSNPPGLILDLRGNPGGLLDQAVTLSDLFIRQGDIVSTRGRHPNTIQNYQATQTNVPGGDMLHGLPILVLIDGRTASAAEIVAAALQATGRAVVAGTTSYGKGTVQTVIAMPNGGEMTLTWSRFYTPSGYALHGLGVLPTLCTAEGYTSPEELMMNLSRGTLPAVVNYEKWIRVGLDDHKGRRDLRKTCPAGDHSNRDALDLDVAQAILHTPGAYRTALAAIQTSFAKTPN